MSGMADILVRIIEQRHRRFATPDDSTLRLPTRREPGNAFVDALTARRGNAIIAEVKMGSPKLGDLRERLGDRFDPIAQAKAYAENGAAALSVVVEPDFFFGSYKLLQECSEASGLPAIAKDFVVDNRQIQMAYDAGASAILLIAAMFSANELLLHARRARQLGLVPLVETHTASDIQKLDVVKAKLAALEEQHAHDALIDEIVPWELVGVNNRDLRTFEVDLQHSIDLLPTLPESCLKVAESGIHSRSDIERLAQGGFDAFLIGETLLLADDPALKLRQLLGACEDSAPPA